MTTIIKNQIMKHLSKFVKNLNPDKIALSTLKGEGQLTNLELDEGVLMDVLEIPTWIVITKVVCNRINIKIPWTKLKTHPICLYLDQVEVELETCRELRQTAEEVKQAMQSAPSKYGFPERVVDGMYINVNSIIGKVKSDTFHADIQLAQLVVQSTTPDWKAADLRYSRIKDMNRGQVLTFKAVEWSTFRLTVDAIEKGSGSPTTPIRLITNQGKICITIKKRLNDCSLVTSRLQVNLDDILLVLTDSQIKAVILHMRSLNPVIQKAAAQSKAHAEAAGEAMTSSHQTEDPTDRPHSVKTSKELQLLQFFERYDVPETAYHLFTKRVDLHICDEMNRPERESFKRRIEGGAMQISITGLSLDYYPYHIASTSRTHWEYFDDAMALSDKWIHTILAHFKQQYAMARNELKRRMTTVASAEATHPPSAGTPKGLHHTNPQHGQPPPLPSTPPHVTKTQVATAQARNQTASPHARSQRGTESVSSSSSSSRERASSTSGGRTGTGTATHAGVSRTSSKTTVKLMSNCLVFRIRGLQLSNVATSDRGANNEENLRNNMFLMSDKKTFHLPPEIPSIHIEYMSFYFPNELDFPVPAPLIYAQINPMQLRLDNTTILWLNQFAFNIMQTLPEIDEIVPATSQTNQGQDHIDIRVDALMQKVLVPVPDPVDNQPDRPKVLQIQVSQVTATNSRVGTQSTRPDLSRILQKFRDVQLFRTGCFPNDKNDLEALPKKFWDHAYEQNFRLPPGMETDVDEGTGSVSHANGTPPQMMQTSKQNVRTLLQDVNMTTYSFRPDASDDVWGIKVDQIWADFVGVPSSPDRPVPFIQPIPLHMWMCSANSGPISGSSGSDGKQSVRRTSDVALANMHLMVDSPSFVDLTLNHYQLLFLLRLQQSLQVLSSNMERDQTLFAKEGALPVPSRVVSVVFPSIHLTLLGPPLDDEKPQGLAGDSTDSGKVEDKGLEAASEADSGGSIPEGYYRTDTESSSYDQSSAEVTDSSPSSDTVEQLGRTNLCNTIEETNGVMNNATRDPQKSLRPLSFSGPLGAVIVTEATPNGDSNHPHQQFSSSKGPVPVSGAHQPLGTDGRSNPNPESRVPSAIRKNNSISDLAPANNFPDKARRCSDTIEGSPSNHLSSNFPSTGRIPQSNSQTSITNQMSALMSANSLGSLDGQGLDFETLSVSSDSSEGFALVSSHSSQAGSTMDLESESGIGSEFSQSLSTTDGVQDQSISSVPVLQTDATDGPNIGEDIVTETKPKEEDFHGCVHKLREVSVLNIDLVNVSTIVEMCNKNLTFRASVTEIEKEEKGNENFTKYMNKLDSGDYHRESVKIQKEKEDDDKPGFLPSKAMLRFTSGPKAEKLCEGGGERGYAQLQLNDVDLNFLKSSLNNLSGIVQDETKSDPMPLDITIFNTAITIQDDSPVVYPDTVAGPPLQLRIPSVRVQRTADGAFHVKGIHPQGISLKPADILDPSSLASTSARISSPSTMLMPEILSSSQSSSSSRTVTPGEVSTEYSHHANGTDDSHPSAATSLTGSNVYPTPDTQFRDSSLHPTVSGGNVLHHQRDSDSHVTTGILEENESLRRQMGRMTSALAVLERERTSLLLTLEHLQEELLTADRDRDKLKEHVIELSRRVNLGR